MQNVSTEWKQTLGCYDYVDRPHFVPISYVEVTYTINDPDAQAGATSADNGHTDYSNTAQITSDADKTFERFATLEQNAWALDGTWAIRPNSIADDTGFNSNVLCGSDCIFASHPIITISFDSVYSTIIPGITITWSTAYEEMARDYEVRVYNGETLIDTIVIEDNVNIVNLIERDISSYDKIEIEIVEWCLPNSRARLEDVLIGAKKVFDKSSIIKLEHSLSADPLSLELPDCYISFELDNTDDSWNPDNPTGVTQYIIEQQRITARYGFAVSNKTEWIKAGTFYMSEWDTPSNGITVKFTARSLIDFMNAPYAPPANTTLTLYALAVDALTQSNLPTNADGTNKWTISTALQSITVTLPEGFKHTCAEVLQLCANAACCIIWVDRDGDINVGALSATSTDYLVDQFVSYKNAEYTLSKPLQSVDVNDGMGLAQVGESGEKQLIDNELIQDGTTATAVAMWVKSMIEGRKTLSGEYRSDPRLDALDVVTTKNKYAENSVLVTDIKYSYGGSFSGRYEGRVLP